MTEATITPAYLRRHGEFDPCFLILVPTQIVWIFPLVAGERMLLRS
jgi:hypothetical protein